MPEQENPSHKVVMPDENPGSALQFMWRKHNIPSIQSLDGANLAMLSEAELALLKLFIAEGRKHGVAVSIISDADPQELARAGSEQDVQDIMRRANSYVKVVVQDKQEELR